MFFLIVCKGKRRKKKQIDKEKLGSILNPNLGQNDDNVNDDDDITL